MRYSFKLLIHTVIELGSLCALIAVVWLLPNVRDAVLWFNRELLDQIPGWYQSTDAAAAAVPTFLEWFMLAVEIIIATLVVGMFIRSISFVGSFTAMMTLNFMSMAIAVGSSLLMAAYAYSILWGNPRIPFFPAYNPGELTFSMGISLGVVGGWYAFTQGLPFIARSIISLPWSMVNFFTSIIPFVVVMVAVGAYFTGHYEWTTYRLAALKVWVPIELLDLVNVAVTLRLLMRGVFGAVVPEGEGHSHH